MSADVKRLATSQTSPTLTADVDGVPFAYRELPNASLRIYPGSDYGGVFQHHAQFVPHVLDFLR